MKKYEDKIGWIIAEHGVQDSRLTVVERAEDYVDTNGRHYIQWWCQCNCGNDTLVKVRDGNLMHGNVRSCGCLGKESRASLKKYNKYDLSGKHGIGWTTNTNQEFYFDLEDYEKIKDYCWREHHPSKNYRRIETDLPGHKKIFLHQLITGYNLCDHKNHNTFDNRKENLREATHQENTRNKSKSKSNKSGFIGVSWDKSREKWTVRINTGEKYAYLGRFDSKEDAIKARLQGELEYFGLEFAPQRHLFEEYNII